MDGENQGDVRQPDDEVAATVPAEVLDLARELPPVQAKAATLLGRGVRVSVVARKLELAETTIRRWRDREDFRRLEEAVQRDLLTSFLRSALADIPQAARTLRSIHRDKEEKAFIRILAANKLLEIGARVALAAVAAGRDDGESSTQRAADICAAVQAMFAAHGEPEASPA